MKLIAKIEVSKRLTGKIHFNKDDNEYIVGLFINGKIDDDSTYFTDCRLDAIRTLYDMLGVRKSFLYGV